MKILSAKQYNRSLKATIQNSGRLGFTAETADEFELSRQKYVRLGMDDNDDGILYLALSDSEDEDSFKVCSSGMYYYLPTRNLFDALGYDYARKKIMFNIVRVPELDDEMHGKAYKMKRRFGKEKEE